MRQGDSVEINIRWKVRKCKRIKVLRRGPDKSWEREHRTPNTIEGQMVGKELKGQTDSMFTNHYHRGDATNTAATLSCEDSVKDTMLPKREVRGEITAKKNRGHKSVITSKSTGRQKCDRRLLSWGFWYLQNVKRPPNANYWRKLKAKLQTIKENEQKG